MSAQPWSAPAATDAAQRRRGRIVTFYSYKGGTGRSMMLANVAWLLASNGKRVLAVDWDLEAPGLHRYLHPFLVDPELRSTEGLIDLVTEYATRAITPDDASSAGEGSAAWFADLADLTRYAFSLDYDHFPPGATFDFLTAGRQGPAYASRVNSFDWLTFYERLGGGAFLDALRQSLRARYDYVLVDSRTGVSDTSGICTVQFPDTLVVCFTLNRQSIEGSAAVAESVRGQRPDMRVIPIPSRVELGEKDRLDRAREYAYGRFATLLSTMSVTERDDYWANAEVLYQPYYAYEEVLAPFADRPRGPSYLLTSVEQLAAQITDGDVVRTVAPPEQVRQHVLARYLGRTTEPEVPVAENELLREELKQYEVNAAATARQLATARRRNRLLLGAAAGLVVIGGGAVAATALLGGGSSDNVAVAVSPATLDFGAVIVNQSTELQLDVSFSPKSTGFGVSTTGHAGFDLVRHDCAADITSCTVTMSFTPPSTGDFSGTVVVSNGDSASAVVVPLTGTGVVTGVPTSTTTATATTTSGSALSGDTEPPTAAPADVTLRANVGELAEAPVTLTNPNPNPITIEAVKFAGTESVLFTGGDSCSGTTLTDTPCQFFAKFQPTEAGSLSATLLVDYGASEPLTIAVTAEATSG